jgi:adenine-specific DNA methylase
MFEPAAPHLIEFALPLKQASLDSLHEKNVRDGHISSLHMWHARRPLCCAVAHARKTTALIGVMVLALKIVSAGAARGL